jgi:hypothetical protein
MKERMVGWMADWPTTPVILCKNVSARIYYIECLAELLSLTSTFQTLFDAILAPAPCQSTQQLIK